MSGFSYNKRLLWLDWMKTLAMFFIIAGHCWVPGNKYIYVFSVPCFFIMSGFLTKKEEDNKVFWKKLWWNLIVPMCLIFLINTVIQFAVQIAKGTFRVEYLYQAPLLGLIGMQGNDYAAGGLKALWFVYTLVLCKIIYQYLPQKKPIWLIVINCLFLFLAWQVNQSTTDICNSYVDLLLAMPFFCLGTTLRPFKNTISALSLKWMPMLFIIGVIAIGLCGYYNDIVMLYKCSYGNNMVLCFVGAFFGTVALYAVSRMLEWLVPNSSVVTIGGGYFNNSRISLCNHTDNKPNCSFTWSIFIS